MNPTNADIKRAFDEHAKHDEAFQDETRMTDKSILDSLDSLHEKLEDMSMKLGQQGERLDSIENKMAPLLEIYNGFIFGRKALIWTAGTVGAITAIVAAFKVFRL